MPEAKDTKPTRKDSILAGLGAFVVIAFIVNAVGSPWTCDQAQDNLIETEQKFNETRQNPRASTSVVSGAYIEVVKTREKVKDKCKAP